MARDQFYRKAIESSYRTLQLLQSDHHILAQCVLTEDDAIRFQPSFYEGRGQPCEEQGIPNTTDVLAYRNLLSDTIQDLGGKTVEQRANEGFAKALESLSLNGPHEF